MIMENVKDGLICDSTAINMGGVVSKPEVREEFVGSFVIPPLLIWAAW